MIAPVLKKRETVRLNKVNGKWLATFPDKTITASPYQAQVFDWFADSTGNGIINAVAGSGKTTTLEMLAALVPSTAETLFCAFNKHIKEELTKRLPRTVQVNTIHSLGLAAVKTVLGNVQLESSKYNDLCSQHFYGYIDTQAKHKSSEWTEKLRVVVFDVVKYCQASLVEPSNDEAFTSLLDHYGIEQTLDELEFDVNVLAKLTQSILDEGVSIATEQKIIDYIDMIWLPNRLDLTLNTYDFVFVDECQDLSRCQLELVLRLAHSNTRYLFVGDLNQAIYGFSGADSSSYHNIKERTKATPLALNVCYRCPTSHIALAKRYVAAIEPSPYAIEGEINYIEQYRLRSLLKPQDVVLCRKTAPLVKLCIKLLASGLSVSIKGRDIGRTLSNVIRQISQLSGFAYKRFSDFCKIYADKQVRKLERKKNSEAKIELLADQLDAIEAVYLASNCAGVTGLINYLEQLFSDSESLITLCTVHRAKGLEANRVFLLEYDKMPLTWKNQQAWQYEQECNLVYVAYTRAKQALYMVSSDN